MRKLRAAILTFVVILNVWFQHVLDADETGVFVKLPDLRDVDTDMSFYDSVGVECTHELHCLDGALDVFSVVIGRRDKARFEPFGHAGLSRARAGDIVTQGNPAETSLLEWVSQIVITALGKLEEEGNRRKVTLATDCRMGKAARISGIKLT